jgi:hypothetical protein
MIAALGLFLVIQVNPSGFASAPVGGPPVDSARLTSFDFSPIPNTQYAGDSFDVTIIAKDEFGSLYPYSFNALLTTSRGYYVSPNVVQFASGICRRKVVVTLADSMTIICFFGAVSDTSNPITVYPNIPKRLVTILPGEQIAPGEPGGRTGGPDTLIAGDMFTFQVFLTDDWYNLIGMRDDSVYPGSTDPFALLPAGGQLSNGTASFTGGLRTAGRHRLFVRPAAGSSILTDTSTAFSIVAGAFLELLLVAPGETMLPGDTALQPWETPGKKGTPDVQFLRTPFPISIYAADGCWNPVTGPGDTVFLRSDFSFDYQPGAAELREPATFSVQFNNPGPNQNIWVVDSGKESYRTQLDIRALGSQLQVFAPETVRAGETTNIRVIVLDADSAPIVAALLQTSVVRGNGDILDPNLLTDTLGVATAHFLATRAQFAEHDTIRISSGNADTLIDIYVDITDSAVMKGHVIAFPNPFGTEYERTEISYYLQSSSNITLTIHDPFGNPVLTKRFLRGENGARAGLNRYIYWDGRNKEGHRVASGIYVIEVVGEVFTGTTFKSSYRIGVLW